MQTMTPWMRRNQSEIIEVFFKVMQRSKNSTDV